MSDVAEANYRHTSRGSGEPSAVLDSLDYVGESHGPATFGVYRRPYPLAADVVRRIETNMLLAEISAGEGGYAHSATSRTRTSSSFDLTASTSRGKSSASVSIMRMG